MTSEAPDPQFRDNEFMVELAQLHGLNPTQINNLEAMGDGSGVITLRYEGVVTMDEQEFMDILAKHRVVEVAPEVS